MGLSIQGSNKLCILWGFILASHGETLKEQAAGCGKKMGLALCKPTLLADGKQTGRGQNGCKETDEEAITVLLGRGDEVHIKRDQSKGQGRNRESKFGLFSYVCMYWSQRWKRLTTTFQGSQSIFRLTKKCLPVLSRNILFPASSISRGTDRLILISLTR